MHDSGSVEVMKIIDSLEPITSWKDGLEIPEINVFIFRSIYLSLYNIGLGWNIWVCLTIAVYSVPFDDQDWIMNRGILTSLTEIKNVPRPMAINECKQRPPYMLRWQKQVKSYGIIALLQQRVHELLLLMLHLFSPEKTLLFPRDI